MEEGHVAIVEPDIWEYVRAMELVNVVAYEDLGTCCPVGSVCCERCAHNFRFRGGHPNYCLDYGALFERVIIGAKPVGEIHSSDVNNHLRVILEGLGFEVLSEHLNAYGMYVYYFALPATGDTQFSDYIDLDALERVCDLRLEDRTIRAHAMSNGFRNETDSLVERGILYGYPLWSSIALHMMD